MEKKETNKEGRAIDKETSILIAVINNRGTLPHYFVKSLFELFNETKLFYPRTQLNFVSSCDINHMRNIACTIAIDNKFDYIIQLDTDHKYPRDMILRLIDYDLDFVCGVTNQRYPPFYPTQFKEFKLPGFKEESNRVFLKETDGLVEVGATGVVGALIKVSALKKLTYPYFYIEYQSKSSHTGGDVYFSNKLKAKGIKMFCDSSLSYPHNIQDMFVDRGDMKHIF